MKKFFKVFFYCTGFSSLNLFMQIITSFPVLIVYTVFYYGRHLIDYGPSVLFEADLKQMAADIMLPSFLLACILTFGVSWLIHTMFNKGFFERLSIRKIPYHLIIIGFLTGCSLQLPISFIMGIIESAGVAPNSFREYTELIETLYSGQNLFLCILSLSIVGPLVEEAIFRGLVFDQLRKNIPLRAALIIQALLFALAHLSIVQSSYAFVTGILLGLSLVWSGSLLLPSAIHIGMNTSAVVLSEYADRLSNSAYSILTILSFILVPVLIFSIYHHTRKKERPIRPNEYVIKHVK